MLCTHGMSDRQQGDTRDGNIPDVIIGQSQWASCVFLLSVQRFTMTNWLRRLADNMRPRFLHIVPSSPGMDIVLRSLVGQERKHEYSLAVARLTCTLPRQPYSCPARHADETSRIRMPAMRIHRRAKRNAARLEPPHIIVVLVVRRHALMSSAMPYESD